MRKYMSVLEASVKWGISDRMVRKYCVQEQISGAIQENGTWFIPSNSPKPNSSISDNQKSHKLLLKLNRQRESGKNSLLYDYLQINMVYSSNRMASNRMTRNQVQTLYHKDKIVVENELIKLNDFLVTRNHFLCVDRVLSAADDPLTIPLIKDLHSLLLSDTCTHKRVPIQSGVFRETPAPSNFKKAPKASQVESSLQSLFYSYEATEKKTLFDVLNLHVKFERIRPFDDCNGRIGRLLMLKECLRNDIPPFIIDDKRRSRYLDGIQMWEKDCYILLETCKEAQARFEAEVKSQQRIAAHQEYFNID